MNLVVLTTCGTIPTVPDSPEKKKNPAVYRLCVYIFDLPHVPWDLVCRRSIYYTHGVLTRLKVCK